MIWIIDPDPDHPKGTHPKLRGGGGDGTPLYGLCRYVAVFVIVFVSILPCLGSNTVGIRPRAGND